MTRLFVSDQLRRFAHEHELQTIERVPDADGRHLFVYSRDQTRRYAYSLSWDDNLDHVLWTMLNPGTGETEERRRNTFERCKRWSLSMGYGGMIFGNVFSLRSKSAKELLKLDPSPDALDEDALVFLSRLAPQTIVAWGNHGAKSDRPSSLVGLLSDAKCFGYTKKGQPRHPLYVANKTPLAPWNGVAPAASKAQLLSGTSKVQS
jgi:hypothetical protein